MARRARERRTLSLRGPAAQWRDGRWQSEPPGSGRELCWFPEPLGGLDCYAASSAEPNLLSVAFPTARRITSRAAATRRDRATTWLPMLRPPHPEGLIGGVRVEVRGWTDGVSVTTVTGAVDRPAVAAGTLAALVAVAAARGELAEGAGGVATMAKDPGAAPRRAGGSRRQGCVVRRITVTNVPFLDVGAAYRELKDDIDAAVTGVLESGWYVLGSEVAAFESEFAAYVGTQHCVGVGNGLDALHLALRAVGVGPGDEVIVPSNTYIATWLAVHMCGASVVPVEPDAETYNLDPSLVDAAVTPRTKAIMPVHLYGQPADMPAIMALASEHGLRVVDDAAQAHGARWDGKRARRIRRCHCVELLPDQESRSSRRRWRGNNQLRRGLHKRCPVAQLRVGEQVRKCASRRQQQAR